MVIELINMGFLEKGMRNLRLQLKFIHTNLKVVMHNLRVI